MSPARLVTGQISLHLAVLPTRCRQTIREIERLQGLAGACCDCRAADTPTGGIHESAEGPKRSEGEVTSHLEAKKALPALVAKVPLSRKLAQRRLAEASDSRP